MTRSKTILFSCAVLPVLVLATQVGCPAAPVEPSTAFAPDLAVPRTVSAGATSDALLPTYLDPAGLSSQGIGWGIQWLPGDPNVFGIEDTTVHPGLPAGAGRYARERFEYGTSFAVVHATAARKNRFYLLGDQGQGEFVLQKWWPKGQQVPGGGPWLMKKKELYRGTSLGPLLRVGVDPQERYALLVHGSPVTLSQMDLASQSVSFLFDENSVPLLSQVTNLEVREHETEGRTWLLFPEVGDDVLLIHDAQNDQILESWEVLDPIAWSLRGYDDDVWSDFLHL